MKLLCCLFSLYILVLSGIPCRADDDCCMEEVAANAANPKQTKGHPEYPRPCSPFFACGASHGFVIPECSTEAPPNYTVPAIHGSIYRSQPLPDFFASIWQPPQVFILV